MDTLIIAPTATWKRDPAQILINDTIKDHTDAVDLIQKINKITVKPKRSPDDVRFKHYQDMAAIHIASKNADDYARNRFVYLEKTKKKNMTYFPDVAVGNTKYLHGLSNT